MIKHCIFIIIKIQKLPGESLYPNLIDIQMSELIPSDPFEDRDEVHKGTSKLSMQMCMNQKRVAVLRFPYSDIRTLPIQVEKCSIHSEIKCIINMCITFSSQ